MANNLSSLRVASGLAAVRTVGSTLSVHGPRLAPQVGPLRDLLPTFHHLTRLKFARLVDKCYRRSVLLTLMIAVGMAMNSRWGAALSSLLGHLAHPYAIPPVCWAVALAHYGTLLLVLHTLRPLVDSRLFAKFSPEQQIPTKIVDWGLVITSDVPLPMRSVATRRAVLAAEIERALRDPLSQPGEGAAMIGELGHWADSRVPVWPWLELGRASAVAEIGRTILTILLLFLTACITAALPAISTT